MKPSRLIGGLVIILTLTACSHHKFVFSDNAPEGDTKTLPATANIFKGGLNQQNFDCDSNRLKQIEIKQNLGDMLLGIITIGAVQKMTVTYDCAKVPADSGDI